MRSILEKIPGIVMFSLILAVGFADLASAGECLPAIDFETDGASAALTAGQIIDDEWSSLGVAVTTHDPGAHPAMIFDSAQPTGGDRDLGSPNKDFGGPGKGSGGGAGNDGANALAQGNVLILSEDGDANDPDDNAAGGTIIFSFANPAEVASVAILDIDGNEAMGTVAAYDAAGALLVQADMLPLGNNSFQTVPVGASDVSLLEVHFPRSGAVAGLTFCAQTVESSCLPSLDFETDADGNALNLGQKIREQWASLGMHVTSHNPNRKSPMIFDSASPTGGDLDLGTPNEDFGGPGVGPGGGVGQAGENSLDQNNVLIISEDNDSTDPDDNGGGGTLAFTFDQAVSVASVDILDIDGTEAMGTVVAFDAGNNLIVEAQMQPLGNNSYQTVPVVADGVRRLEVRFPKSGAVAGITFCEEPPVTPCPCVDSFPQFAAFLDGTVNILACSGNGTTEVVGALTGYLEAVAAAGDIGGPICGFLGVPEEGDDVFLVQPVSADEAAACRVLLEQAAADQGVSCN